MILHAVSPLAIIGAAYFAWKAQRRIVARRNTLDFIGRHEISSREWRDAKQLFSEITSSSDHPAPLEALLKPSAPQEWKDHMVITSLLNHFEAVAVCIKHRTLSESIYKDWNKSRYISAWDKAQHFIREWRSRRGTPTTWVTFEHLARKWQAERIDPNQG